MPVPEATPPASVQVPLSILIMPGEVALSVPPNTLLVPPLNERVPERTSTTPLAVFTKLKLLIVETPVPADLRSVPLLVQTGAGPPRPWLKRLSPVICHRPPLDMTVVGVPPMFNWPPLQVIVP